MPLADAIAVTVVPKRRAMAASVSPGWTVYVVALGGCDGGGWTGGVVVP
jgi:hypothetical protein